MVLAYISILSPLYPLIVGFKNRRSMIFYYVLVCFIFDLVISIGKRYTALDIKLTANLFVTVEYIFIALIYTTSLQIRDKPLKWLLLIPLIIFFTSATPNGFHVFNVVGASIFHLSFILFALAGFFLLIRNSTEMHIEKLPFFWLNVAFIIYGSGNFLLFLFRDEIAKLDVDFYNKLWLHMHALLNIFKNIVLGVALSKNKKV